MVYLYSTINMMHGPINIRFTILLCFTTRTGRGQTIMYLIYRNVIYTDITRYGCLIRRREPIATH